MDECEPLLLGRLERFTGDLIDGGQSRLKQRDREQAKAHNSIKVGRCRLTASQPMLIAPLVSALETAIS